MPSYQVDLPSGQDVRNAAHTVSAHTGVRKSIPVSTVSTAHWWDESPREYDRNLPYYYAHRDPGSSRPGVCTVFCYKAVLFLCVFILPPMAVFLQGGCNKTLVINLLLTLLGWIPGVVHAIFIICCTRRSILQTR